MSAFKYIYIALGDSTLGGRKVLVGERIEIPDDETSERLLERGLVIETSETHDKVREQRNADSVANARAQRRKMGLH